MNRACIHAWAAAVIMLIDEIPNAFFWGIEAFQLPSNVLALRYINMFEIKMKRINRQQVYLINYLIIYK